MSNITNLFYSLPNELQIYIFEYNPEHRKKMYWVLEDIRNPTYCDNCEKTIKTQIYSRPRRHEKCCSIECVDELYN